MLSRLGSLRHVQRQLCIPKAIYQQSSSYGTGPEGPGALQATNQVPGQQYCSSQTVWLEQQMANCVPESVIDSAPDCRRSIRHNSYQCTVGCSSRFSAWLTAQHAMEFVPQTQQEQQTASPVQPSHSSSTALSVSSKLARVFPCSVRGVWSIRWHWVSPQQAPASTAWLYSSAGRA
jgi:hypothetical protein